MLWIASRSRSSCRRSRTRWLAMTLRRYRLRRVHLIAQHEFLDLAGRGFRYRPEHNRLRRLEARHMLSAECDDVGFRRACVLLQLDERAGHLAPFGIRLGDHGCEQHCRMLVEHVLDFDRGDVLATGDDDVLGTVLDDDVAVLVEHAEVAGVKPAAFEYFAG